MTFFTKTGRAVFLIGLFVTLFAFTGTSQSEDLSGSQTLNNIGSSQNTVLASGGQASMDVVVSPDASRTTTDAANELADYLGKITGGSFSVTTGNGSSGIAVGTYSDFPDLDLDDLFDSRNPARGDEHIVHSHGSGVYLVGASDLASQHAIWTFLHELGFRQFFPTETWEIIPDKPDLSTDISSFESPDFYNRAGPRRTAHTDRDMWRQWHDRNRMISSFSVNTGHAYGGIIRRNQEEFDANPNYTAGSSSKFRVSEEGLVDLVVQDAVDRIKSDPDILSISMDPSDGGGWAEDEAELAMGTVSDRVVFLANKVAEAINDLGYGDKYVGIYAYNQHSQPPNIEVHPNVIVSIATSYIRGAYTVEQLVEGWGDRSTMIGIRDYYDTFVWAQGKPRRGPGGNINYLVEKIPFYHEKGARFMNANSTDSWAVNGLGFYISSRLLWSVDNAERVDELIDDFLEKSFGKAKEPMREFYELVARGRDIPRTNSDLLANMYRYIKEAVSLTDDPNVLTRLEELALYTRYVELWFKFEDADSQNARDVAAQNVFRHTYRMQSRMMSPVRQLYVHLNRSDVPVDIPAEIDPGWLSVGRELKDIEPWKSSKLFTGEEIIGFVEKGVVDYEPDDFDFDIISYSEDLVPAVQYIELPAVSTGSIGRGFRGRHSMFTWLEEDQDLPLEVRAGTITHYQDRGNVRFHLMSDKEATTEPVDTDFSVPPDNETYEIKLFSPYNGLHELEWNDGNDRTYLHWPDGLPMTLRASANEPFSFQRDFDLYFYVPEDTEVVGGYVNFHSNTHIYDGSGNEHDDWKDEENNEGYFSIAVPEGQDGTLWRIEADRNATLRLMTVPPYLARDEQELLLPKELFEEHYAPTSADQEDLPDTYDLGQNYPNPFNPVTQIRFAVPEQSHITLEVYNVLGQRVTTLLNEEKVPGRYEVNFDGTGLSSGVYLYRLQTDAFIETKQMLLVK